MDDRGRGGHLGTAARRQPGGRPCPRRGRRRCSTLASSSALPWPLSYRQTRSASCNSWNRNSSSGTGSSLPGPALSHQVQGCATGDTACSGLGSGQPRQPKAAAETGAGHASGWRRSHRQRLWQRHLVVADRKAPPMPCPSATSRLLTVAQGVRTWAYPAGWGATAAASLNWSPAASAVRPWSWPEAAKGGPHTQAFPRSRPATINPAVAGGAACGTVVFLSRDLDLADVTIDIDGGPGAVNAATPAVAFSTPGSPGLERFRRTSSRRQPHLRTTSSATIPPYTRGPSPLSPGSVVEARSRIELTGSPATVPISVDGEAPSLGVSTSVGIIDLALEPGIHEICTWSSLPTNR